MVLQQNGMSFKIKKSQEFQNNNTLKKPRIEDEANIGGDDDSGIETRLAKCDDGGYTSSSNASNSSIGQQMVEWTYFEEAGFYETIGNKESSNNEELKKKQKKVFRQPSTVLPKDEEPDEGEATDREPLLKGHIENGHISEELDEIMQLQRQLTGNTNQLRHLTTKVKKTGKVCDKEIKELKTFLLWLDKRNSDVMKSTVNTKAELVARIIKLENDVETNQEKEKKVSNVSEKIISYETQQACIENITNDLRETVKKNTESLSFLLSRFSLDDNNLSSSSSSSSSSNITQQMDNIERRLTKVFCVLFVVIFLITFITMFWMNNGQKLLNDWQRFSP